MPLEEKDVLEGLDIALAAMRRNRRRRAVRLALLVVVGLAPFVELAYIDGPKVLLTVVQGILIAAGLTSRIWLRPLLEAWRRTVCHPSSTRRP